MRFLFTPNVGGNYSAPDGARYAITAIPDEAHVRTTLPIHTADTAEQAAALAGLTYHAPAPQPPAPPAPLPVPASVPLWKFRAITDAQGLTATIDAALAAMPDGEAKHAAVNAWQRAPEILRDSPTVLALAAQLHIPGAQLDDIFRAAQRVDV